MRNHKVFLAVPGMLALLFQGCGSLPVKYVQAYYEGRLQQSEIAWVTIGNVRDRNNARFSGSVLVLFDGLPQTVFRQQNMVFGFPAGNRTLQAQYYYSSQSGSSRSEWVEVTRHLEGGKCYEINDVVPGGGPLSLAPDQHDFRIEECSCTRSWSRAFYGRVELYRLGGYRAMPRLDLVKSYDFDDDVFADLRRRSSDNRIAIPAEFIRQLCDNLE
jgi:hypothetical protein